MDEVEISEKTLHSFYKKIGENVKKYRDQKGLTQMQLGLAIGHNSAGTVGKSEICIQGKHFNLKQLYKISKVLDVDIRHFFDDIEEL